MGREEGTAQQTSLVAPTLSLGLVHRELTVRVIMFTAGSMHEQFHCAERLFQQLFIGTDARVFHDTSPQRIMKCDACTHEETFTYVVLSGHTTMFPSFGECAPNELTVSALHTMQFGVICPQERKFSVWVWAL